MRMQALVLLVKSMDFQSGLIIQSGPTVFLSMYLFKPSAQVSPRTLHNLETVAMTTDTGTSPTPAQLADRLAIQDVLHLHCRGLDRLDKDTIQCAYWPEAEVDYGSFKGNAHLFAELVVGALGQAYELTQHSISNTLVQFTGNIARSESTVHAGHLLPGAQEEMLFYGRYLDRLEKRNGRWKILHRQVVMDWSKRLAVQDERGGEAFAALAKGAHIDTDPLYPFLECRL
jgi:SnoaL-like domain